MDALKSAAHSAADKFEEGFHSVFTNITGSEEHEAARLKSQQQSDANFDQARVQARSKMISTSDSAPVVMEKADPIIPNQSNKETPVIWTPDSIEKHPKD